MKQNSITDLECLFLSPNYTTKIVSPFNLRRYDSKGGRFYFIVENNQYYSFLSVTSFCQSILPTSAFLIQWLQNNGKEESERLKNESALYGTLMHILIGDFLQQKTFDIAELPTIVENYVIENRVDAYLIPKWILALENDLLSFAQWCFDYEVEAIAIEFPIASKVKGIAGTIDLVCSISIEIEGYFGEVYKSGANKGEPKLTKQKVRQNVIVDFKSGRKGFFDSHELQLHCYKDIWNEHYSAIVPIDNVFNFAPTQWQKKPTYKFKDQSDSKYARAMPHLLASAEALGLLDSSKEIKDIQGILEMNVSPESMVTFKTLKEIVLENSK